MKILIAGAGAIGGWLAGLLAGHEVTLLGRAALAQAVERDGLSVTGLSTSTSAPRVITEPAGEYDVVFITCKAHQTGAMAASVAGLAPVVATLQNGLGNGEKIAKYVAPDNVVICLTSHGVNVTSPGKIIHAGQGPTKVGPLPGQGETDAVKLIHSLLTKAGLNPILCPDMRGHIWQKAIINAGINPVAAMFGIKNGALLDGEPAEWRIDLVAEALAAARHAGVELPPGDYQEITANVCAATANNRCSMLQDVQAGRLTEIEQITGRFLAVGAAMPRSLEAYNRIKQIEYAAVGDASKQSTQSEEQTDIQV